MREFVGKLAHDRRWTYQGSLTTAPFSEGILWNVIEQVIPIRQSTLNAFNEYKKIEESELVDKFDSDAEREWHYKNLKETGVPDYCSVCGTVHGDTRLFRTATCSRQVQDPNGRAVYHIDVKDD